MYMYFLKVEDGDVSKSSGSVKGKKQVSRKFEYCYEPEMEEVMLHILITLIPPF